MAPVKKAAAKKAPRKPSLVRQRARKPVVRKDVPIPDDAATVDSVSFDTAPDVPAPITPHSDAQSAQDRVIYENTVNDAARAFGRAAELKCIDALLAGKTVTITVS